RQYGRLYLLVEAAVSRRQELEADQLSVRVAGRATAQATLRELPVLNAAWGFYSRSYVQPGWEAGYAPLSADFFGGFQRLLAARANELAELRTEAPPEEQSRWDSHPSVAVRVAAMDAMPDQPVPVDTRPATDLVPRFDRAAEVLFEGVAAVEGRRQVGWDEFTTAGLLAEEQRQADVVYRAAARLLPGR